MDYTCGMKKDIEEKLKEIESSLMSHEKSFGLLAVSKDSTPKNKG